MLPGRRLNIRLYTCEPETISMMFRPGIRSFANAQMALGNLVPDDEQYIWCFSRSNLL